MTANRMLHPFKSAIGATLALGFVTSALAAPEKSPALEMPNEVTALGDPDSVCVAASVDALAMVNQAKAQLTKSEAGSLEETGQRQLAFYAGKLTGHMAAAQAGAALKALTPGYLQLSGTAKVSPTLLWCARSYFGSIEGFPQQMESMLNATQTVSTPPRGQIDPASLDPDALCFVVVGMALPGTMNAAKTNAKAADGVTMLGRAQHFYLGRLLARNGDAKLDEAFTRAMIYGGQLEKANDTSTPQGQVRGCIDRQTDTVASLIEAMISAMPASKPGGANR